MKVLLVDDSRLLRLANQRALTNAGHIVTGVIDGEEALRVVHKEAFDIIVLDMMLPKIPGLTVLRNLKADSATKDIPVVVLSGLSGANAAKLREEGAAAYVVKRTTCRRKIRQSWLKQSKARCGMRIGHGVAGPRIKYPPHTAHS
jgi:CheY-like chemotaxis protein